MFIAKAMATLFLLMLIAAIPAFAGDEAGDEAIDAAMRRDILKFIELTKFVNFDGLYEGIKNKYTGLKDMSDGDKARLMALLEKKWEADGKGLYDKITNDMVPVFAGKFTHKEIKRLVAIYDSPVLKKFNAISTSLAMNSSRAIYMHVYAFDRSFTKLATEQGLLKARTPAKEDTTR